MFSLSSRAAFPPWASELLGLPVLRGEYFYLSLVGQGGLIFFVQKYSVLSVPCRHFHILVYCAKILVRYRYMLHGHHNLLFGFDQCLWNASLSHGKMRQNNELHADLASFLLNCARKKHFLGGFVQKCHFFWGLCRNITVPSYCTSGVLCRAFFRGCAEILIFGEIFTSGHTLTL